MAIDRYTVPAAPLAKSRCILDALDTPHQAVWVRYAQGVIGQYAQRGIVAPRST